MISSQHNKRQNEEYCQFLQLLTRELAEGFPNPDRTGCPDAEFLKRVARHQIPILGIDPWIDHLGSCSECFGEFNRYKAGSGARWRRDILYAATACIVLAIVGFLWKHLGSGPKVPSPVAGVAVGIPAIVASDGGGPQEVANGAADTKPLKLILDLTRSPTRGETSTNDSPMIRVPARLLACRITLPFASSDGLYYVRVQRTVQTETLEKAQGTAEIHDGDTLLDVNLDLSHMTAGKYSLSYRHAGQSWRTEQIAISNLTNEGPAVKRHEK